MAVRSLCVIALFILSRVSSATSLIVGDSRIYSVSDLVFLIEAIFFIVYIIV